MYKIGTLNIILSRSLLYVHESGNDHNEHACNGHVYHSFMNKLVIFCHLEHISSLTAIISLADFLLELLNVPVSIVYHNRDEYLGISFRDCVCFPIQQEGAKKLEMLN